MYDPWCAPFFNVKTGKMVSGGAARNLRISLEDGMQTISSKLFKAGYKNGYMDALKQFSTLRSQSTR